MSQSFYGLLIQIIVLATLTLSRSSEVMYPSCGLAKARENCFVAIFNSHLCQIFENSVNLKTSRFQVCYHCTSNPRSTEKGITLETSAAFSFKEDSKPCFNLGAGGKPISTMRFLLYNSSSDCWIDIRQSYLRAVC